MALTAGTGLDVLVTKLNKAGWGDIGDPSLRGCGSVLLALAAVLNPRSGAGKTTAPQLAQMTRFSERWVRRCLTLLEDLDVIEWHRGGIVNGAPTPSWIRVNKRVVVDLVAIARKREGEHLHAKATETRRRVARLRTSYTQPRGTRPPKKRNDSPRHAPQPHAEPSPALRTLQVEAPASASAEPNEIQNQDQNQSEKAELRSPDTARTAAQRVRDDLAAMRGGGHGEKRSNEAGRGVARGVGRRWRR